MSDQFNDLAKQISAAFQQRLGDLRLSPEELALVDRASERVASATTLALAAPPEVQAELKIQTDLALATLENVGVAKALQAAEIFRQTALDVTIKAIHVVLGIAAAV